MKIRNIITSFRTRRPRGLARTESVSFEAFCNEQSPTERPSRLKESTLTDSFDISPVKVKSPVYEKFMPFSDDSTSRPSLATILLFIVLSAVFLILPIIYLLNCFDIIYEHHNLKHMPIVKEAEHYEPSLDIHTDFKSDNLPAFPKRRKLLNKSLPDPPPPDYNECKILADNDKFDCFPHGGADQESCEARGCCWVPAKVKPKDRVKTPKKSFKSNLKNSTLLGVPYCFYPANAQSYQFINVQQTDFGLIAYLNRTYRTPYPKDVLNLKMIVKYESEDRLRIKFVDVNSSRYEPAYPELPIVDNAATNLNYILEIDMFKSGFKVVRKSDNVTIFDSINFMNFIFADQFLQMSAKLPSKYIYGLGEHTSSLLLDTQWTSFTLFNHDMAPEPNKNLYGSHPFYLCLEESGNAHGVFLMNSNAMDILLQPTPAITFRTIGGILDFYFFMGPTPADVVAQYTELIGRPYMPPYWALGFHLCRFGYKSLNETQEVMERNIQAGIPLDTQWNDLDYMNNSNDFTYDKVNFAGLPDFVDSLHKRGMHYVVLIDPGVSAGEQVGAYPPFDEGLKMDIFVKNTSGQPFIGKVWNSHSTVWPDFTHPNTVEYWTLMLKSLHNEVPFDGAWIDMNEPSNFLNGAFDGCPKSNLESPPYVPNVDGGFLNYKTMCMSAKHYGGLHYNVHNLYGFAEAIITSFSMADIRGKRPMVISRSTFSGHGHYAGHWSGDVWSTWDGLRESIPHLLSFSLFGIPLMGADICGFNGNTTAPLCNRWQQLGAFYPFSRNHNTDDGIPQDPVAMGSTVVASTKKAFSVRYALLPYLYTLFYKAHILGDTVARPLFFEWHRDTNTYGIDRQFLWGSAVMIVPVLEENAITVEAYLPESTWYDYYTKSVISTEAGYVNLTAPADTIPVLIRGGFILPCQGVRQTTTDARKTKVELLVAPDASSGEAYGDLFWDDGDSLNTIEEKNFTQITFGLGNDGVLRTENVQYEPTEHPPNLGKVTVMGLQKPVSEVLVNNMTHAFRFDTVNKYLTIDNLDLPLEKSIVISWK